MQASKGDGANTLSRYRQVEDMRGGEVVGVKDVKDEKGGGVGYRDESADLVDCCIHVDGRACDGG